MREARTKNNGDEFGKRFELRALSAEDALQEHEFLFGPLRAIARAKRPSWAEFGDDVRAVLARFDERATFDEAPIAALKDLGFIALRPDRWETLQQPLGPSELRANLQCLRGFVWSAVERWRYQAERADTVRERRAAAVRLQEFCKLLSGTSRGRREKALTEPIRVVLVYRQLVFRLQLARKVIADPDLSGPRAERVRLAAERTGLPLEHLRDHLLLDEESRPKGQLLSIEQTARIWTARAFGVNERTVANVLSRSLRVRSRRSDRSP